MNTAAFVAAADQLARAGWPIFRFGKEGQRVESTRVYEVTDRLHEGRAVRVPGDRIVCTVSTWLGELGVESPLVHDLARAVCSGDWPAAYAIGEHLSVDVDVDVAVAACAATQLPVDEGPGGQGYRHGQGYRQ